MHPPVQPLALLPAIVGLATGTSPHLAVARGGTVGTHTAGRKEVCRDLDRLGHIRLRHAQATPQKERIRVAADDAERAIGAAAHLADPQEIDVDPDLSENISNREWVTPSRWAPHLILGSAEERDLHVRKRGPEVMHAGPENVIFFNELGVAASEGPGTEKKDSTCSARK